MQPIITRLQNQLAMPEMESLIQVISALTACFKGLAPSEDDIFDGPSEEEQAEKEKLVLLSRQNERMVDLRRSVEQCLNGLVAVSGEPEVSEVGVTFAN
jgi:hypothetical protein